MFGWPPWLITFWYSWIWIPSIYNRMSTYSCSENWKYQNVVNHSGYPIALVSIVTTLCVNVLQFEEVHAWIRRLCVCVGGGGGIGQIKAEDNKTMKYKDKNPEETLQMDIIFVWNDFLPFILQGQPKGNNKRKRTTDVSRDLSVRPSGWGFLRL